MNFVLQPWQLLVVILTGWLNRQQQAVIDFLLTQVQMLKETHGVIRNFFKCKGLIEQEGPRPRISGKHVTHGKLLTRMKKDLH